ncbi:Myoglobin, partial [Trichinella papuae]
LTPNSNNKQRNSMSILKQHLNKVPPNATNGGIFYKNFFMNVPPSYTKFFGYDHINPAEVPSNPKFQKLGEDFLKQMNIFVDKVGKEEDLKNEVKKLVVGHKAFKVGVNEFKNAGPAFMKFMEAQAGMSAEQKKAWEDFFTKFIELASLF